jgi:FUZ/MON1/HPS1 family protein
MFAFHPGVSLNQWSVSSRLCGVSFSHLRSKTRSHLEYLYLQVLSIVTVSQLRRIFERRTNFDLGRLLGGGHDFYPPSISETHSLIGSEVLVHSLLERVENDMAMGTSSLHCLKLDPLVRSRAANHLIPTSKMKVRTIYTCSNTFLTSCRLLGPSLPHSCRPGSCYNPCET